MRTANINSLATTNALLINSGLGTKGAGVSLRAVSSFNAGAAAAYLKLYNLARPPVVGTDIPVMVIAMPANSNPPNGGYNDNDGMEFNQGLAIAITALPADTDTTAVAAGQVKVNIAYL